MSIIWNSRRLLISELQ